ncbi:hypothetical protein GIB67_029212 [Kingdonia uniflora]|uniref:Leucine-rich repeat-containing N-terminal plant-type domain-containing protein n=1 Tax=Kingdonia uniflora TaxID=39325 RepID=A0A7J7NAN7_9MAGN|nr:hypothetical protein GIB67_029212 [Kingdonia uniflora]
MGLPASFVFLVVIANTLLITPSLALTEDCKALLEIKRCLNDTQRFLSNWRASDHSPCNWTGITCHLRDHRVISINLGKMQLGGSISPSFMKLSRLQRLALHENKLHGLIPAEITTCMELRALYLRANYLQGGIPLDIGNLSHLTALDLSSNSLMGPIPPSIGLLIRLQFLNLSINFFSGDIPNVGVMSTFGNKSFLGNLNLCGLQIQKPCLDSLGFPAVLPHKNSGISLSKQ